MRGLAMLAWVIGGLPVAAFVATLALTDGAPVRAPSAGSGMPDAARLAPDLPGQPALAMPAGIPTSTGKQASATLISWTPPAAAEFRDDRHRAGWDRLRRLAEAGDRDALVFLTLMRTGEVPRARRGDLTP